jgi:hypothetical protein
VLATALVLAACGSNHHTVDGGHDSAHDTLSQPTADAPPGSVTIEVTSGGKAVANVPVYFQNIDSTVVLGATTDTHGTVGAVLAAGGFVTAIEPDDGTGITKLATFAGVQPGDALHLDLDATTPPAGTDTVLTVAQYAGAVAYDVYSPCGMVSLGPSGTGEVAFQGCPNVVDLLVVAVDDTNTPLQAYFKPSVTIGPAPSDAMAYSTDISAGNPFVPLDPTSFAYTAVPSTVAWVKTTQELWGPSGRLFDQTNGAAPTAMTASYSLDQPAATGLLAVTVTDVTPDSSTNANQHGEQLVYDWDTWSGSYGLDITTTLLAPYLTDPMYVMETHELAWTEGTGTTPDFARARIMVYRDAIPTGTTWTWSIIAPRTLMPKLAFPTLPTESFDFNPMMTDTLSVSDLTNVRAPGGYDGFRAHGFADFATHAGTQGGSGKIVIEIPFSMPL